ncbi:hypothetical protein K9M74_05290 [Candidatus Woesearchaeota archaeon]|nr:hypothetical protein [Candidatus Woesearchaeota archaeon]
MATYISGMLTFANFLIALFVLLFAFSFLHKTRHAKERRPWVFLLIAVTIFFFMQIINIFGLFGVMDLDIYRSYFDSMFLAIILFTFIFQYNLILNSELILIRRKKFQEAMDDYAAHSTKSKKAVTRKKVVS